MTNTNLTVINNWEVPTKEERETILNYSHELDRWYIYTDVPKHARKYEKFLDESKPHRKGYSDAGNLSMIEGYIAGANVTISKKATMTDEQKRQASERLKEARKKQLS
ncbi:hypothetical protein AB9M75_01135 [Lactobacillus sp. AN1001]